MAHARVKLFRLTVDLTSAELAGVSRAAVVVTSSGDRATVNAAERGWQKVRAAARSHPDLRTETR